MTRVTRRLSSAAFYAFTAVFAVASTVLAAGDGRHSQDEALFSASEYQAWISRLASDELEGRGTGQEGIDGAQDFIAATFENYGVEPAGDDGTYFQNFTLHLEDAIGKGTRLAFGSEGRRTRRRIRLHEGFVPMPWSESRSFKGDVVFAGYGIVNADEKYDDYADIDVAGKVVLIIRQGPSFGNFGMQDKSFRAKADRAADHDAAAVMIVNRDGDEALYDFKSGGRRRDYGIPMLHITPQAANRMLEAADMPDIQTLQDKIEKTKRPASAPLEGVTIKGKVEIEPVETPVRNVVGMIPGQGPQADEIIILGAHHDHLGIKREDSPDFNPEKDIYNGADDNASGTAMVMNMAKAYTQGAPPNRSILVMTFTGEELGLLGSHHFAKHPTVDIDKCVAMLNFDMVGRLQNDNLEVGGMRTGGFEDMVHEVADDYDLEISDGGGGQGPSDHSSFYNAGLPVLFLFTGIHKQYHQPEDDAPLINSQGAMRVARFATDIIDRIDANADAPTFSKDKRRARLARQTSKKKDNKAEDAKPADPLDDPHAIASANRPVRLGIHPQPDDEPGVLVAEVIKDSPAERAGLKSGDRIVRLGDRDTDALEDLLATLSRLKPGDRAKMKIARGDERITLDVFFGKKEQKKTIVVAEGHESLADIEASLTTLFEKFRRRHEKGDIAHDLTPMRIARGSRRITFHLESPDIQSDLVAQLISEVTNLVGKQAGLTFKIECALSGGATRQGEIELSVLVQTATHGKTASRARPPHGQPPKQAQRAHAQPPRKDKPADPHADGDEADDADDLPPMPGVRLGIIPTYGAPEGEGYEISGVTEGGPAAVGGMKDNDRIYKIGDRLIADVYDYMESLHAFKPGDMIKVIVIRDGKKVTLEIKAGAPKSNEAS